MFLFIFFSLYFLMHIYFIRKTIGFYGKKSIGIYLTILMTFSPFIYNFYDKAGYDFYFLSFFILMWMGFIILFSIYYLIVDFYNLSIKLFHIITKHNLLPILDFKKSYITVLLVTLFSIVYGYNETLHLNVNRFEIYSNNINRDIKILHISDLHLNQVMREDKIKLILDIYEKEKPDIVISTGDLVDGNVKNKKSYISLLKMMNPPLGKYAVLGNHEYYAGVNQAIEFTEKAGFKILRDSVFSIGSINMVGVDDIEAERFKIRKLIPEVYLFNQVEKDKFVIFLKHQPALDYKLIGKFDLMLSGHTHGGVLFPVKYILRKIFVTDYGFLKIGSSYIYVSRGVGTGGPPIRIGCPPDVAIFEIKRYP